MKKEDASLEDEIAEEIYSLSAYVWKWTFILTLLLALIGSVLKWEIGIIDAAGMMLSSVFWATLFALVVILFGKHSLIIMDKIIRAWQEIKKALE